MQPEPYADCERCLAPEPVVVYCEDCYKKLVDTIAAFYTVLNQEWQIENKSELTPDWAMIVKNMQKIIENGGDTNQLKDVQL